MAVADDGLVALEHVRGGGVDLLVLDLGLPGMDGLEVCRRHPARGARPPRPHAHRPHRRGRLRRRPRRGRRRLRQQAVPARRAAGPGPRAAAPAHARRRSRSAACGWSCPGRRVLVDGAEVGLANKEFELLRVLLLRAGQVVTREEILREVWNDPDLKTSQDARHAHVVAAPQDRRRAPDRDRARRRLPLQPRLTARAPPDPAVHAPGRHDHGAGARRAARRHHVAAGGGHHPGRPHRAPRTGGGPPRGRGLVRSRDRASCSSPCRRTGGWCCSSPASRCGGSA